MLHKYSAAAPARQSLSKLRLCPIVQDSLFFVQDSQTEQRRAIERKRPKRISHLEHALDFAGKERVSCWFELCITAAINYQSVGRRSM